MRIALRLCCVLLLLASMPACAQVPVYGYKVVKAFPHDRGAFTEGLFWHDGYLYESTGEVGRSTIRKVDLASGEVVQRTNLRPPYYGEGIIAFGDKLYQLTWRSGTGFVYDFKSFKKLSKFQYSGEGWALTTDGKQLYMSDGTPVIRVLDPKTMQVVRRIHVTWNGNPVARINELEWIKGEIWANIWLTHRIARIDPATGAITAFIDLGGLVPDRGTLRNPTDAVLNGIAWDQQHDRIFVTGKNWPKLYQIELVKPE